LVHTWRCLSHCWRRSTDRLHLQLLLILVLGCGAFAGDLHGGGPGAEFGVGHAHHLVGDAIGLVLQRIVHRPDVQLWLQSTRHRVQG
jgi:membrane associated rhomboid family serine protease